MDDVGEPREFGRVAVLMGGVSAERAISLDSGGAVLQALRRRGVDAEGVDVGRDFLASFDAAAYDRAFIVLHGRGGEDGTLQGALELLHLPYTGSGVLGSALGMDKVRCKQMWQGLGIPTPPWMCVLADTDWGEVSARLGLPVAVKPAREGSSLGVSRVEAVGALPAAFELARRYDTSVLAERWIAGAEYSVPILHGRALPMIRLETPRAFYDYEAKYNDDRTRYLCPCGLGEVEERAVRDLAVQAFAAIGAEGWGRIDLIIDAQGAPWLMEANTVPGMTSHSLVPMGAATQGMDFDDLVIGILRTSLAGEERP